MKTTKEELLQLLSTPVPSQRLIKVGGGSSIKPWLVAYQLENSAPSHIRLISQHTWIGYNLDEAWSLLDPVRHRVWLANFSSNDVRVVRRVVEGTAPSFSAAKIGDVYMTTANQPLLIYKDSGTGQMAAVNLHSGYYSYQPIDQRGATKEKGYCELVVRPATITEIP